MRIGKTFAAFSMPVPAIFEPCDSLFIEANRAADAFRFALDSRLPPDQGDEGSDRSGDPPDGEAVKRVPDDGCGGKGDE